MNELSKPVSALSLASPALRVALELSSDLAAVTDRSGRILWCNRRFAERLGIDAGRAAQAGFIMSLARNAAARNTLLESLRRGALESTEINLAPFRSKAHEDALPVEARAAAVDDRLVWTFRPLDREHQAAADARYPEEVLALALGFGRFGVWRRDLITGEGEWDREVFEVWGLDPNGKTPTYREGMQRVHPDDREALSESFSSVQPGVHAHRYRVIKPSGETRWIRSQWHVMNDDTGRPARVVGIMADDTEVYNAARALSDLNAQLKMAVDLGHIAIWRHDLATDRVHLNPVAFDLIGIPPSSTGVPAEDVKALVHADDWPQVLASIRESLHSDQPVDIEARFRRADGSWRYILARRVALRAPNGRATAFVGVALDVTDRVERMRHAEALSRRLDAATHAARVGIWSVAVGDGEADWNQQMFELFDRPHRTPVPSLRAWLVECVDARDRGRIGRQVRQYMRAGEGPFETQFRTVRRDARAHWVVLRADVDRTRTDQRRLLGVVVDVTDQHEALDTLRKVSERSALIAGHAGIGTWEYGPGGIDEHWDEQMFRLRGLTPGELPSRAERLKSVHPDDVAQVIAAHPADTRVDLPSAYEYRVKAIDGSWRWLASRSVVIVDSEGEVQRRVGVNWDVTAQRNAEIARQTTAVAEREMQAKSQFLSRMSHELRTPMNAVLGFTQLLQIESRRAGAHSQLEKLAHIRTAADHLLSLINGVLELSALESGEMKLSLQPVDLALLVAESIPLVQSLAHEHRCVVRSSHIGGFVAADPTRLRQVLINLLSNAIKYNKPGGEVTIETRADDEHAWLVVRDTGRGLSADQLSHLFEPFNRFGAEHEAIEGTGIGLTIVKALVDGMNGRIDVSSVPGEGSVFEVMLRVSAESAPFQPGATLAEALALDAITGVNLADGTSRAVATRAGRLLYIEDNVVNVLLVEELVGSLAGLQIDSEQTGIGGVARAKSLVPDLVLVDLQLPDIDGFEVLRRLRADPATRAIPCIALSANALPEDITRGLDAGFTDYWTKPINFRMFLESLERLFPAPAPAA